MGLGREEFAFGPWKLISIEGSILKSTCNQAEICPTQEEKCELCRIQTIVNIPLPEMLFANNILRLEHQNGFGVEFNAIDALKLVDDSKEHVKVAYAEEWLQNRPSTEEPITESVKRYDWTYSTKYMGTIFGDGVQMSPTSQRIDLSRLKLKEKIFHYKDIMLFEDELADNGCACMRIKVRVMPGYIFFLLRFFLRVDNVLARIYDTRIFHQAETNTMLREFLAKECDLTKTKIPYNALGDPGELDKYLHTTAEQVEEIRLPTS